MISTSNKLKASSRKNECPVCADLTGKCRINGDESFFLCMGEVSALKFEVINSHKCIGHTKDGMWGKFIPVAIDTYKAGASVNPKAAEDRARKLAERALEELEIQANSLSVDQRHEFYSQILASLSLSETDRSDLLSRGFSEAEIELSGFKSYEYGQSLSGRYPDALPGIKDGNKLIAANGYLLPCKSFDGKVTGLQIRLRGSIKGGRYRWLSNDSGLLKIQPENENPLAVYHPQGETKGIAICEGTGAKPFFVAQKLGYMAIGASGGLWLNSPQLLSKYLNQAFNKYGKLPVTIFPDAGFGLNLQVADKLKSLIAWLENYEVLIADWNQVIKSVGDIDEIQTLEYVRYLKSASFLKKYKQVFENGKKFKHWAESRVELTPDIIQHEQYLTIPKGIEKECDLLLVRKGLGGGKTQGSLQFVQELIDWITLLIGYRNTLLEQTIARANALGLKAIHIKDSSEVIGNHTLVNHVFDSSIKLFAGCADSFFKLDKVREANNGKYLVVIDEICSVLHHLKGGGTLKARRKTAIDWTENTIGDSGFSLCMDGNLCNDDVNFIKQLYPDKRVKVLDSIHEIKPRTFFFAETKDDKKGDDFSTNRNYLPSHLVELAKEKDKFLWISDSQRSCEVTDTLISGFGAKTFRLDGKTSQDEISKHFLNNPKLFIELEQIEALMLSPSAESGLSIDTFDYFDGVLFDIRGTAGINTLVQLSARLRDTKVPIYVACPEFANMTKNECPYPHKVIQKVFEERAEMMLSLVLKADPSALESEDIINMFTDIGKEAVKDPWTVETLKDSVKLVHEHNNLKLYLKTALQQAGNFVHDLVIDKNEEVKEEVKATKEEVMQKEAEKIYNSVDLTPEQVKELERKEVNYDTQCAIKKAKLKEKLPGIEETESWTPDFVNTVLLQETKFLDGFWNLQKLKNQDLTNALAKLQMTSKIEHGVNSMDVWKNRQVKLEVLSLLGISEVIDAESFSIKQENIQSIVDKYYQNDEYFRLLGITKAQVSEKQPNKHRKNMINKFLDVFGLGTEEIDKTENDRFYRVCVPEEIKPYLTDIKSCYERKAEAVIEEGRNIELKTTAEMAKAWKEYESQAK